MKILVLASRFPYPLEKGDKLRLYFQLRELAKYHQIILCAITEEPVQDADFQTVKSFCSKIHIFPRTRAQILRGVFFNLLKLPFGRALPFSVAYFFQKDVKKQVEKIASEEKPDTIFCQLVRMTPYAEGINLPKTLDYMDTFSVGMARRAQSESLFLKPIFKWEARRLAEYEAQVATQFDNLTIISEQDKTLIINKLEHEIVVVPNGVDTVFFNKNNFIKNDKNSRLEAPPQYHISFVGNMGYYPNIQAAKFLVEKILPLVARQIPDIRVLIAGARPTPEVMNLATENVVVTGFLSDIRTAYTDGQIFVAPIFHGSGQQNKILEAMAMSVPCITTSMVNNAINATPDTSILLADTEGVFAEKIIQLLQNVENQNFIRKNALDFVQKKYGWSAATKPLINLFR